MLNIILCEEDMKGFFKQIVAKALIVILILISGSGFVIPSTCYTKINKAQYAKHMHSEASYQKAWCEKHCGIMEYRNDDMTRVDCLTDTHAVEFDFANKWAESVGQALYYQHKTGKKAMVVLILEHPETQMVYFKRVQALSKIHDFDVEYVTPDILKIDEYGCCQYKECKCHKK